MTRRQAPRWLRTLLALYFLLPAHSPLCLADDAPPASSNGAQILEQFGRQQPGPARATVIAEHERQVIMFSIGTVLLILLLSTASVGIAVAVFGKPLFLVHMILAGLTVTVALVHVIVGVVWFFPF
ncbi:MAG: hypothetical protein ABSH33_14560 [Steroidobacteraceae bacterium]|jgi:hypothetical protein